MGKALGPEPGAVPFELLNVSKKVFDLLSTQLADTSMSH